MQLFIVIYDEKTSKSWKISNIPGFSFHLLQLTGHRANTWPQFCLSPLDDRRKSKHLATVPRNPRGSFKSSSIDILHYIHQ